MHKLAITLKTAVRALQQHKLRSVLSVSGVVCGVMAVLTMVSIGEGAKQETIRQLEQLGLRNIYIKALSFTGEEKLRAERKLSKGLLTSDGEKIHALCKSVEDIAIYNEIQVPLFGTALEFSPKLASISDNYPEIFNLILSVGRLFSFLDIRESSPVCILGSTLSNNLGKSGEVGSKIRVGELILTVVGVLESNNETEQENAVLSLKNYNEIIFIPLGLERFLLNIQAIAQDNSHEITEIIVKINTRADLDQAATEIDRIMSILHNNVDDYDIVIPLELIRQAKKTKRVFNIVLGSIAGISLLVGGIGIMNIMLANVTERTREIGIRRAIGARRFDIITQFLAESIILTLTGGLLGICAGIGMALSVSSFAGWAIAITFYSIMIPFVMSLLVGIFFGLYPALKAANMHPISALRYE